MNVMRAVQPGAVRPLGASVRSISRQQQQRPCTATATASAARPAARATLGALPGMTPTPAAPMMGLPHGRTTSSACPCGDTDRRRGVVVRSGGLHSPVNLGPAWLQLAEFAIIAAGVILIFRLFKWLKLQIEMKETGVLVPNYIQAGVEVPAKVEKVDIEGTVTIILRTSRLKAFQRFKVWLDGIDMPYHKSDNPSEREAAVYARQRLVELMQGEGQILRFRSGGFDMYGRPLGTFYCDPTTGRTKKSVNQILVDEGYAYAYSDTLAAKQPLFNFSLA